MCLVFTPPEVFSEDEVFEIFEKKQLEIKNRTFLSKYEIRHNKLDFFDVVRNKYIDKYFSEESLVSVVINNADKKVIVATRADIWKIPRNFLYLILAAEFELVVHETGHQDSAIRHGLDYIMDIGFLKGATIVTEFIEDNDDKKDFLMAGLERSQALFDAVYLAPGHNELTALVAVVAGLDFFMYVMSAKAKYYPNGEDAHDIYNFVNSSQYNMDEMVSLAIFDFISKAFLAYDKYKNPYRNFRVMPSAKIRDGDIYYWLSINYFF